MNDADSSQDNMEDLNSKIEKSYALKYAFFDDVLNTRVLVTSDKDPIRNRKLLLVEASPTRPTHPIRTGDDLVGHLRGRETMMWKFSEPIVSEWMQADKGTFQSICTYLNTIRYSHPAYKTVDNIEPYDVNLYLKDKVNRVRSNTPI